LARNTIITLVLVIASLLLAVALFMAGAIWRGRVTSGALIDMGSSQPRTHAECALPNLSDLEFCAREEGPASWLAC
jgi:hypothetical protein